MINNNHYMSILDVGVDIKNNDGHDNLSTANATSPSPNLYSPATGSSSKSHSSADHATERECSEHEKMVSFTDI